MNQKAACAAAIPERSVNMEKDALLKIVEEVEMKPLFEDEVTGTQLGWYKATDTPIFVLEALVDQNIRPVTLERMQLGSFYRYTLYCPHSWFN